MGHDIQNQFLKGGIRKALLASVATGVTAGAAIAQVTAPNAPLSLSTDYFGYAAGVSVRGSYSDNINLQRDGLKNDEYILSTFLTGGAIYSSPRVTAVVLGDLDFSYLFDQSDLAINQNIGFTSTFTGVDNLLYFDLSGSTSRQLIGDNARFSGNINAARGQRADVHSYSASPYLFRQFADESSAELRYRFSQVFVDQEASPIGFLTGNSLNDSTTHEVLAQYDSGRAFDRLGFRLTAFGSDTSEDGVSGLPDFEYQQGSLSAAGRFSLSNQFALSGAVGYDEVDTAGAATIFFNDDDLSGFFWRAGFTAQPGPRSLIRLEYGERYGDEFIDAEARYDISDRFVFSAGASRSFRTRAQSVSSQFRSNQRQTLDFADALREGQELSARSIIESANWYANSLNFGRAQTTGVAVSDTAYASLAGEFGRTSLSVNGFYSDDNFGFRQIETIGGSFNLRRRMSRRLTGYGSVSFRHADTAFDPATCEANPQIFGFDVTDPMFNAMTDCANLAAENGVTNTLIGRIGASYQIYENVSAFIEASHTERFAPNPLLEYGENNVLAGVTLDF
ncbi:hypothetical protein PUV54_02240 [Hyphococcus flavus]|uniref:TIGR03016 family PEP-CTERM system-associated outer membrane protein n=1 Tax=Hyphococcus flavus TaxID=1866326 RepID=A0AAF0CGB6_9PROT|nr:hypothetical protein [Hyphococcus flavus]WDI32008.1 hypothetical protein PUV54_02240 [Hyphococcus flavus]